MAKTRKNYYYMFKTLGFGIITENIACSDFFKVLIFVSFYMHILLIWLLLVFQGLYKKKIPCYVNSYLSGRTDFM